MKSERKEWEQHCCIEHKLSEIRNEVEETKNIGLYRLEIGVEDYRRKILLDRYV